MHDVYLITHNHLTFFIIHHTFNQNLNFKIYMAPKFSANINFKLSLRWFKYVNMKILSSIIRWEIFIFSHIIVPKQCPLWYMWWKRLTHIDPPKIGIKVTQKQLHVIPLSISLTSRWHIDIAHSKDKVHTLVDIIILDLICANLLFQATFTQRQPKQNSEVIKTRTQKINFFPQQFFKNYLHNILMNFYTCVPPMHKF